MLCEHFHVDAGGVHAFIIAEHGDSEVPVWSLANIAGMKPPDFCQAQGTTFDANTMEAVFRQNGGAGLSDHPVQGRNLPLWPPG